MTVETTPGGRTCRFSRYQADSLEATGLRGSDAKEFVVAVLVPELKLHAKHCQSCADALVLVAMKKENW